MRTNIQLDDELITQTMEATGAKTKRAVVDEALRLLLRTRSQESIRHMHGKVEFWDNYRTEFRSGDTSREW